MKKMIKIKNIILSFSLITAFSCGNDVKQANAPKRSVKVSDSNAAKVIPKHSDYPDTAVAFFWPTQEYFETLHVSESLKSYALAFGKKAPRHNVFADYETYLTFVAQSVFNYGDAFDFSSVKHEKAVGELKKTENEKKLQKLKLSKDRDEQIAVIESDPVNAALIMTFNDLDNEYEDQIKITNKLCKDGDPGCKDARKKEKKLKRSRRTAQKEMNEVLNPLTDPIKDQYVVDLANLETRLSIPPLQILKDRAVEEMSGNLKLVQVALDPDGYETEIKDSKKINLTRNNDMPFSNWVELKDGVNVTDNEFIVKDQNIRIKFGRWGNDLLVYESLYARDENEKLLLDKDGKATLLAESDIINMEFDDATEVLKFTMLEKDIRGKRTGQIYDITLQRSLYPQQGPTRVRFLGDLFMKKDNDIVRRGQMKIDLPFVED